MCYFFHDNKFPINYYAHVCTTLSFQFSLMNQKITLTINQDNHTIASPIAAYLRIVSHFWYFFSSPAEVTIKKPAYRQIATAIVAKIHNNQLIVFLIVSSNWDPACFLPVIMSSLGFSQLPVVGTGVGVCALAGKTAATQASVNIHRNAPTNSFFIFMCNK